MSMLMSTTALLLGGATALAGSGPWTLSPGDLTLYAGAESRRATQIMDADGALDDLAGGGVSAIGGLGVLSVGILPRVEGSLMLPAYRARSLEPGDPICDEVGEGVCRTSEGIGTVQVRVKGLLLDELYGPPVSLSVAGELRLGDLTAPTRGRLTALGEGTTDLGVFLSAGRSGGLGEGGLWSVFAEGGYRHRLPNTTLGGDKIPGDEIVGGLEALLGPSPRWMVGPTVYALRRTQGFDLNSADFVAAGAERFVGLSTTNLTAGGKLILRSSETWSVALSGQRTILARNGFGDELVISAGVSTWRPAKTAAPEPGGF